MKRGACLASALALLGGTAHASQFTGLIDPAGIRFSTGTSPARVSVAVPMVTACGGQRYYAYENADSGLGGLWTEALIQARVHGRPVMIVGTGTCDNFGIEKISHIDLR
ncbi:hypothetical protein G4177_26500 [Corallococcus sp. ZKHCc1 1396]|uniref:Uncharacterized protein n=1 Tax=Corallococcus soli TaxID=2710757 RepID=A0ABR9PUW2_9BACT|nr:MULTISPECIES: hypothetical protein [Corallococcus]MBE4751726.1 hypothetical protein [Corallococcus soli]MCY1035309.1 hypothetical protein [Corallococcus sp. BB11-1]RYZ17767.1 MAG: hypothetical protein EOO70_00985 [Myxococcaceae bacterium]